MKIKRKVEMTCGEFAKYMVDKFGFSSYESKLTDGDWLGAIDRRYDVSIHLPPSKVSDLPDITITKSGVVIFEVEEEITEDTVIPKMLILDNDGSTRLKENHRTSYYRAIATKALYLINDDYTMTLIWKNGKLVE